MNSCPKFSFDGILYGLGYCDDGKTPYAQVDMTWEEVRSTGSELNGKNVVVISQEKFSQFKAALNEAAELLDEVRTGEDFECVCWNKAVELRNLIK